MASEAPDAGSRTAGAEGENGSAPYGADYFRHYWGSDLPYERNERWMDFFGQVADRIAQELQPHTVLDAGCAMGMLVEQLNRRGIDAWGVDVSQYAIENVHESVADRCWQGSLTEPLPRKYDLILCIEVLEHLDSADAAVAMSNLCKASNRILFSSTPGDFGEPTHVNVRPPEDWTADFAARGFFRNLSQDFSNVSAWAALYERQDLELPEVVRAYDRAQYNLRQEARELRGQLMEVRGKLERHGTNVDELKDELLQVRDELIHLEMETGQLRGENAELRGRYEATGGTAEQLDRIQSTLWWRVRAKALSPYHRMVANIIRVVRR